MPKLGLTMSEGRLASWMVGAGDRFAAGDLLFAVETDKITNEVEAPFDGEIIELTIEEGETVAVGAVLARCRSFSAAPAVAEDIPPPRRAVTPLARRLARQHDIDLEALRGSGPNGRIKAQDVEAAIGTSRQTKHQLLNSSPRQVCGKPPAPSGARRGLTNRELLLAERLTAQKQQVPHFYAMGRANVSRLIMLRDELNAAADERGHLTLNHFLIAALGRTLVTVPKANTIWEDGACLALASSDVGIAVQTDGGLLVPMLRGAGHLSLFDVAERARSLVDGARNGRLTVDDFGGGAVSVSNVGMFGAAALVPIISPGQSSILGVGRPEATFRPNEKLEPVLCHELELFLSCDHRVLDGADAARMIAEVCRLLEQPLSLLRPAERRAS